MCLIFQNKSLLFTLLVKAQLASSNLSSDLKKSNMAANSPQVLAVTSAHLVTMETLMRPGDSVNHVSVTETSTRLTQTPVTPAPASVGAACTTAKELPVRAASWVTMATRYYKTAGVSITVTIVKHDMKSEHDQY